MRFASCGVAGALEDVAVEFGAGGVDAGGEPLGEVVRDLVRAGPAHVRRGEPPASPAWRSRRALVVGILWGS